MMEAETFALWPAWAYDEGLQAFLLEMWVVSLLGASLLYAGAGWLARRRRLKRQWRRLSRWVRPSPGAGKASPWR